VSKMSEIPKRKKRIKLWQLVVAVILMGIALAWLLGNYITLP
jgi:hypothetical protein